MFLMVSRRYSRCFIAPRFPPQAPPSLERQLRPNLDRPMAELVASGEILTVSDPMLCTAAISIRVELEGSA